MKKERDSHIELLRLVSMFLILIGHVVVHGLYPNLQTRECSAEYVTAIVGYGLAYVGAPVFVLISGFYSIKFKWKGLFSLYLIVVIYTALWQLGGIWLKGWAFDLEMVKMILLPFTHRTLWFVYAYVILYCLSPFLNAAVESLSFNRYRLVLLLLTFLNVYFGYWQSTSYNSNGYTFTQMIFLYVIAGYIRRFISLDSLSKNRVWAFAVWVLGALCWSILTIFSNRYPLTHWCPLSYNNPFTLISSVGFFCWALTFQFQCKTINWLAKSCFAIYLLQNKMLFERFADLCYSEQFVCGNSIVARISIIGVLVIVFAVSFMLVAILIDRVRMLVTYPIFKLYDQLEKIITFRYNKT